MTGGLALAAGHAPPAALRLRDVAVRRGGTAILEGLCAQAPAGQMTAIIGPNGAGKTSLFLGLLGLARLEGEVLWHGLPQRPGRPGGIGYVPQRLDFDRGAPVTVLDFLLLARQRWPLWFGAGRRLRDRAAEVLGMVEALPLLRRRLGQLSGGELQRVLLAHALMDEPEFLFLDEPISGVDAAGERRFCELLEEVRLRPGRPPLTVVMVSHDLDLVAHHAGHVICLKRGRLAFEGAPGRVLEAEVVAAVYGPPHRVAAGVVHEIQPLGRRQEAP